MLRSLVGSEMCIRDRYQHGGMSKPRYPRNYRLFNLCRVLSVREESPDPQLTIAAIAVGCGVGFRMVAIALSNGSFVFRFEADNSMSVTHTMQWHREPGKVVTAMCFDPSAKILLCATLEASVSLIPVHELIVGRGHSDSRMLSELAKVATGPLGSTILRMHCERDASKMLRLSQKKGRVVDCIWWNAWDTQALAIVGFDSGMVEVVSLSEFSVARSLKVRAQITKLDLVEDPTGQYAYVLIHSAYHGVFQLTLGLRVGARDFQTLLSDPQDPCFNPMWVSGEKEQLGAQAAVSLQYAHQGPLIASLHKKDTLASRLQVFDPELSSNFALYEYQLFPSVSHVQMCGSFLFVVSGQHKMRFSVISRLLAEVSTKNETHPSEACMQQFQMPDGQNIRGLLRCRAVQTECTDPGCTVESQDTMYLWTADTVYECCCDMSPEQLFTQLVTSGLERNHAEPLGQTLELDVLQLYLQVGEEHFSRGQYDRAIAILAMSDMPVEVVVQKFAAVQQLPTVSSYLQSMIHSAGRTTRVCTMLLCVQMCLLLHSSEHEHESLLAQVTQAVSNPEVPLQFPLMLEFAARVCSPSMVLQLGWHHNHLAMALNALSTRVRVLDQAATRMLITLGTPAAAACVGQSRFFSLCLSPSDQLEMVLSCTLALVPGAHHLPRLLQLLGQVAARRIFAALDPSGVLVKEAIGCDDAPATLRSQLTEIYLCAAIQLVGQEGCWDEDQLLAALWRHLDSYRATLLATEAQARNQWRIGSAILEFVHRFAESLICKTREVLPRLQQLAKHQDAGECGSDELLELCEPMMKLLGKAVAQQRHQPRGTSLAYVVGFWSSNQLPGEWLELLLVQHLDEVAAALGQLDANSLPASTELRARAAVARIQAAAAQLKSPDGEQHHNLHSADMARLQTALAQPLQGSASVLLDVSESDQAEAVVFTCGHVFGQNLYQQSVLPCYRSKLCEVLTREQASEELLEALMLDADIQDGRCCSACPFCVVCYLRQVRMEKDERVALPVWRYEELLQSRESPGRHLASNPMS
eukprot:TRINITY_DN2946_c0_g1_i1.p1 TRINITY_DN2946_c0_g1~~TRINITY_DN2946_c0_g1_i1.p1  ORF type:complete len:1090 (+),score=259.73 TRINITY_DN2946_c0_g1_i1:160-3270(+)